MRAIRFVCKNWLLFLVVLVVFTYFLYNYVNEGFQNRNTTCTQLTCRGSNSWINNKCYRSCNTLGGGKPHRDTTKCTIKARPGENDRVVNRHIITSC